MSRSAVICCNPVFNVTSLGVAEGYDCGRPGFGKVSRFDIDGAPGYQIVRRGAATSWKGFSTRAVFAIS